MQKLVIFSPLPPQRNGIADYVAELLPLHAKEFDLTVVVSDTAPAPTIDAGIPWIRLADYKQHGDHFAASAHCYHIGNNKDHVYFQDVFIERPGLIVLHDFFLDWLTRCWLNDSPGKAASCRARLNRCYGEFGLYFARRLIEQQKWIHGTQQFLSMADFYAEHAVTVVTHSNFVRQKLSRRGACPSVEVIPHHLSPNALEYDSMTKDEARRRLGLPRDALLFLSLGFLSKNKQINQVLQSLAAIWQQLPAFCYVLAGEERPDEYDVRADVAEFGLEQNVIFTGYVPSEHFFLYIKAADIVVNLRYPSGGEASGPLLRALGMGCCAVVTDRGSFAEYPDEVLVKIPWAGSDTSALEACLQRLAASPSMRRQYALLSREHVRSVHALERSAERYHTLFHDLPRKMALKTQGKPLPPRRRTYAFLTPVEVERELTKAFPAISGTLNLEGGSPGYCGLHWWREGLLPYAQRGARLLVVGSSEQSGAKELARTLFGYATEAMTFLDATTIRGGAAEALPQTAFDGILASLCWDSIRNDPVLFLASLNRMLAFGGVLTLDLWVSDDPACSHVSDAPAPRHDPGKIFSARSATHSSQLDTLSRLLPACGFAAMREATHSSLPSVLLDLTPGIPTRFLRGEVSFTARKESEYINRWPDAYYVGRLPVGRWLPTQFGVVASESPSDQEP